MNKAELIAAVSGECGLAKNATERILNACIATIQEEVANGGDVTLVGFGTFRAKSRAAREGRDPRTGASIRIGARNSPSFAPGKAFKELVASRATKNTET